VNFEEALNRDRWSSFAARDRRGFEARHDYFRSCEVSR
jgi:hypothetical protein